MKLFFSLVLLCCANLISGQTKKEVFDGIFVTFPKAPEYSINQGMSTYSAQTTNALYLVFVRRNAIPNYSDYVQAQKKWTQKDKEEVVDALLDNTVKGKLDFVGIKGKSSKIKLHGYDGRTITYQAINPITGQSSKVHTTILLVRSSLVILDTWNIKDESKEVEQERSKFFNSINTN